MKFSGIFALIALLSVSCGTDESTDRINKRKQQDSLKNVEETEELNFNIKRSWATAERICKLHGTRAGVVKTNLYGGFNCKKALPKVFPSSNGWWITWKDASKLIAENQNNTVASSAKSCSSRPSNNKSSGFFVKGRKLYDANCNQFSIRGIGLSVYRMDSTKQDPKRLRPSYNAIDNIATYGFNTVRINWGEKTFGAYTKRPIVELEQNIQRTIDNKMIPLVDLHAWLGKTNIKDWLYGYNQGVNWIIQNKSLWQKYEKQLLLQITNEPGDWCLANIKCGYQYQHSWHATMTEAVKRIRAAGINVTLIVPTFEWGHWPQNIHTQDANKNGVPDGIDVFNSDPQKNTVFTLHFYEPLAATIEKVDKNFKDLQKVGVPWMITEFGEKNSCDPSKNIAERRVMQRVNEFGESIGYSAWVWADWFDAKNLNATGCFSIVTNHNNKFDPKFPKKGLTPWGQSLILDRNGIRATSKKASIY